jgi:hypothetical protein
MDDERDTAKEEETEEVEGHRFILSPESGDRVGREEGDDEEEVEGHAWQKQHPNTPNID